MDKPDKLPEDENKQVTVIMADTDKQDRQNFKEAVSDSNIDAKVTTVNTGQELLDNLQDDTQANPDIIFMDINMELANGKDCLKEIKKDEDLKDIPTVIYTASNNEKDIESSFRKGALFYLPKPVFFRNLVRLLRKIFTLNWKSILLKPLRRNFLLSEESVSDKPLR